MFNCLNICAVLLLVTKVSQSQISDDRVANSCDRKVTCSECIQTKECTWCMDPLMDRQPRCFHSSLTAPYCKEEYQWNPKNQQTIWAMPNYSGDSAAGSVSEKMEISQIVPQRVALKLRMNEPLQIQLQYSEVKDFPLDFYFLMDLSKSMESDKEKMFNLGESIAHTLPNLTSNFRLGFGSFVNEIVVSPSSPNSEETAYAFKNHMSLGTDVAHFSDQIRKVAVTGNSNSSGGGLKAIMQAIVCRYAIGWRENARRVLVFSTNTGFNFAEIDERDEGMEPLNDGYCHLDPSGMYAESRVQNSPSISQISSTIQRHAINVVFAVTSSQFRAYQNISNQVIGSSVGVLSEFSDNVVELVRDEYNKILSTVEIKDTAYSEVEITYSSSCSGGNTGDSTNKCESLQSGQVVSFNAEVVLTSCPEDKRNWFQTFQIYPVGVNSRLNVELEMLCGCQCENSAICEDDYSGPEPNINCRRDNSSLVDCSGRGSCVGDICECSERPNPDEFFSGRFCECDNFSCERHNRLLCSGSDHGTCSCGVCQCEPGWTGNACECRISTETCKNRGGAVCSGHGTCECGACRCDVTEDGRFSGRFCEKCPTCSGFCHELKTCVECQMYKTGPLAVPDGMCAKNCTKIVTIGFDTIEADETNDEHLCTFYDDDGCRFQFVYVVDALEVRAQKERECPQKFHNIGVMAMAVAQPVEQGIYDYSHKAKCSCSNDYNLFTEPEIKLILEEVFRGLKQCRTKEDQLQLMMALAVKYIYWRP